MNIFILEFLGQVLSSQSTVQGIAILDAMERHETQSQLEIDVARFVNANEEAKV